MLALDDLKINTANGLVPISSFVKRVPGPRVDTFERKDGVPVQFIRADVMKGVLASNKVKEMQTWIDSQTWDPGLRIEFKGANEEQAESMQFISVAFLLAVLLMFVMLVAQFNSLYQAFLIVSAVVMSTAGVLLGLVIMGKPFSAILTGVGVVSLAGIVVNHNIILLSSYNHLRREHPELDYVALIVRAGAQRVRPVLLTTVVTVLGLLPMAFNMSVDFVNRSIVFGSQMSLFWVPLSQAIVWGLTFATVLTLVCTPAMLALPHSVQAAVRAQAPRHHPNRAAQRIVWWHRMIRDFLDWYMGALESGGYWLVGGLMALESSVVPLPSEVVIPPAAHLAYTNGNMTLTGIVVAGTLGSWLGATIMYWGARLLGRPLLMRYGRYVLISPEKIVAAQTWADRFGTPGVFISRLLPVIRHLIGIPAGIVRMHYGWYSVATLVGSAIWCTVLCWVGVTAGQDEKLMQGDLSRISLWLIGGGGTLLAMYYVFVYRHMRRD